MTEPLQVLILEDRPADAELMVKDLEREGYSVAWQRVEAEREFRLRLTPNLDLVLADYSLPGMTALDALRILRQSGMDIPFVVVSGSLGDDRAVQLLKEGATDYILKDRMARLGPAVRRALMEKANRAEIRRAHKALAASEDQMRSILSTVEDVVWSLSLETGNLLYVSPTVEKLTGRPVQQFLIDPQLWLQTVHPEDYDKMVKAQDEAIKWGTFESEYRMLRADGNVRDVLARAWTAYNAEGKAVRLEGIFTDVTEKRAAERARAQSEVDRKESQRLAQLNEFKSQFIRMVAHDLNNVLTPMRINVRLLEKQLAGGPGEAESKPLQGLHRSVERLASFLGDLLDAARLQAGRLEHRPTTFDFAAAVEMDLHALQPQFDADGVQLTWDLPQECQIEADPQRLAQVTTNLLSNALKFTPSGGKVHVEVRREAHANGGTCHVLIRDSGRGIAPTDVHKLFQPFAKIGPAVQRKHTGTGLGLFICKGIVDAHGGRIWCESPGLGQGSTFHVSLPAHSPGSKPARGPSSPPNGNPPSNPQIP